ncbi:MAG: T9SS type A sorting domain-containing protein [Chloroherpetonaceae bacterium]|nr:T9SS type A sorting domain-containing protein [Chloroherpetonaceae bacterium]
MKKFISLLAISLFLSVGSQAQVFLLDESFSSGTSADSLNGTNGWVKHSGGGGTSPRGVAQIYYVTTPSDLGNSLNYSGLLFSPSGGRIQTISGNSEDLNKALSTPVTSGVVYLTALVKVLNTTGLSATAPDYFLHFAQQSGGTGVSSFGGRLFVRLASAGSSKIQFGIQNNSGGSPTQTWQSDSLDVNQTAVVVVKYDLTASPTQTATLWVNPTLGGSSEPTANASNNSGTNTLTQVGSVCVRQGNAATGNIEIDEIRVSQSWGDVSLPVELSSFNSRLTNRGVELTWSTASETNNAGFEVERSNGSGWSKLSFVKGNGTTTEAKSYSFNDASATGRVSYRLKQVDFDGKFEYSSIIEVDAGMPRAFELSQNYPNPFNPSTTIAIQLPVASEVKLEVFDLLGRKVATLLDGKMEAGRYSPVFEGVNLSSGVYLYRLQAGAFVSTKKMMLVK